MDIKRRIQFKNVGNYENHVILQPHRSLNIVMMTTRDKKTKAVIRFFVKVKHVACI